MPTLKNYNIRRAVLTDIPEIMSELKEFSSSYKSKHPLYKDDNYTSKRLTNFITEHFFYVATKDERVIGFVSGVFIPHLYNPDVRTLVETFWWVKEEYRASRVAFDLLNKYIEGGKESVDWIIFSIDEGTKVKEESLINKGFRLKEKCFLLEVE